MGGGDAADGAGGAPQVLNTNTETSDTMLEGWNVANRPSDDSGSESATTTAGEDMGGGLVLK